MINYLKWYFWFIKESYSFMAPRSKVWITLNSIPKAHGYAKSMCEWDKLTPEQREAWYLSGEGRTFKF